MVDQTVYGNANFGIIIGFLTKAMLVSRIHGAVTGIKTYLLNKKRKMNKGMSAGILGVNILNLLTDPSKNHPLKDTLKGAALNVPNIDFEDGTGVNGDVKEKYQELQTLSHSQKLKRQPDETILTKSCCSVSSMHESRIWLQTVLTTPRKHFFPH